MMHRCKVFCERSKKETATDWLLANEQTSHFCINQTCLFFPPKSLCHLTITSFNICQNCEYSRLGKPLN